MSNAYQSTLNPPKAKSGLGDWIANAALLLVTLALAWGAAEAYVAWKIDDGMQFDLEMWRYAKYLKRVSSSPAIGHEHTPNTRAHLMGADVVINSQGLRDREFPLVPPPGKTRIVMLGDSLTFGWGVEGDETYSKVLERMLAKGGYDAEVINTGVGNYNTEMEVAYFLERGYKLKPQYVVLNYFINDAELTPRDHANFFARHSPAYVYFSSRFDMALRMMGSGEKKDWKSYYAGLYEGVDGPGRVAAAIEKLAKYCRENNIKLYIANQPELRNPREYAFPQVDRMVEEIAAANKVPYIPMLPAVRDLKPESLWVTQPDPHPSAVAHEAFAKELYKVFATELKR